MNYAVKIKCEGYLVAYVEAKSEDEALQIVEEASFYVANDDLDNCDCETADANIIWCKDKNIYDAEEMINFERKFEHILKKK